jgi:hypothetical protein
MGSTQPDRIKHREVLFRGPHQDPHQARSAALLLSDLDGIHAVRLVESTDQVLHVTYDVHVICLQYIEEILIEVGFHLDNSLLVKLKRAIYYYTEQVERETQGCRDGDCTRKLFIEHYRRHLHGCRDERPEHWRRYL